MIRFLVSIFFSIIILHACNPKSVEESKTESIEEIHSNSSTLFLLSKGLTTDTLKETFLSLLDKEVSSNTIAVVVNASSSEKKKYKKTYKIKVQMASLGFDSTKVALFDLMKNNPDSLLDFDIIYILGGNPFLLFDEVQKSKSQMVFKKLQQSDKLLMGYSAGALLMGPGLKLMDHVDSLLGFNQIELRKLDGLEFYDFYIFPHFLDFTSQVPELEGKIKEFESRSILPVYRLNDQQGIIYKNGEIQIIGH